MTEGTRAFGSIISILLDINCIGLTLDEDLTLCVKAGSAEYTSGNFARGNVCVKTLC